MVVLFLFDKILSHPPLLLGVKCYQLRPMRQNKSWLGVFQEIFCFSDKRDRLEGKLAAILFPFLSGNGCDAWNRGSHIKSKRQ